MYFFLTFIEDIRRQIKMCISASKNLNNVTNLACLVLDLEHGRASTTPYRRITIIFQLIILSSSLEHT